MGLSNQKKYIFQSGFDTKTTKKKGQKIIVGSCFNPRLENIRPKPRPRGSKQRMSGETYGDCSMRLKLKTYVETYNNKFWPF
jgi:hypothetical protein